ncbi:hypothetical protein P7K49_032501 [Saguinus oedipus]|uniref:Uncharacterized protein n=1 Tax=Saguinus oedipus TaxID=9490 RepID=A0ABQ9TZ82_SAGOE|nr:hypothetical protein P7K49_032501 [Saguinus oedipus]
MSSSQELLVEVPAHLGKRRRPWQPASTPALTVEAHVFLGCILKAGLFTMALTSLDSSEPACQHRPVQDWPQGHAGAGSNQTLAAAHVGKSTARQGVSTLSLATVTMGTSLGLLSPEG